MPAILETTVSAMEVLPCSEARAPVPRVLTWLEELVEPEVLELLANTGPGVDPAYRDELVARFELDLDRPARAVLVRQLRVPLHVLPRPVRHGERHPPRLRGSRHPRRRHRPRPLRRLRRVERPRGGAVVGHVVA